MNYIENFFRNHLKGLIVFTLIMGLMVFSLYNLLKDEEKPKAEEIAMVDTDDITKTEVKEEEAVLTQEEPPKIYVDIKGAVNNPGVYEVSPASIIYDVVKLAGGFTDNAYHNNINLSKKVKDEMVIFIYTQEEIALKNTTKEEDKTADNASNTPKIPEDLANQEVKSDEAKVNEKCEVPSYNITECVEEQQSIIETTEEPNPSDNSSTSTNTNSNSDTTPNSSTQETEEKTNPINDEENTNPSNNDASTKLVNINTADVSEFTTIKGIGESKAKAIIQYREENGNFKTIEDIKNVSGIGDATFEKIKAFITV